MHDDYPELFVLHLIQNLIIADPDSVRFPDPFNFIAERDLGFSIRPRIRSSIRTASVLGSVFSALLAAGLISRRYGI